MKTWLGAAIVAVVAGGVAAWALVTDPAPAQDPHAVHAAHAAESHQGDPINLTLTCIATMSIVALLILLFSRRRHGNGTGQSARPSHDAVAS